MKTEKNIIDKIIKDYINGISNKDLCKKYKLHRATIQRILKKNNIKLHMRKSDLDCNDKFFNKYNKNSCYWAGFILADGYIRKDSPTLHIKLSIKDKNHLYHFLDCIKCKTNIVKVKNDYCYIDICKDNLIRDLKQNFEITNAKTFTAKISNKIPKKYIYHFIRGYFDGDGSIINGKSKYLNINMVGTFDTLEHIMTYIYNENIHTRCENKKPKIQIKNKNIGFIYYSGKCANKILDMLYKDSSIKTRLNRKFKLYKYFNKFYPKHMN